MPRIDNTSANVAPETFVDTTLVPPRTTIPPTSPVPTTRPPILQDELAILDGPGGLPDPITEPTEEPFFGGGGGGGGGAMVEDEVVEEARMKQEIAEDNSAEDAYNRQKMLIFGLIGIAVLVAGILIYRRMRKKK